jgi:hypothetical protein
LLVSWLVHPEDNYLHLFQQLLLLNTLLRQQEAL